MALAPPVSAIDGGGPPIRLPLPVPVEPRLNANSFASAWPPLLTVTFTTTSVPMLAVVGASMLSTCSMAALCTTSCVVCGSVLMEWSLAMSVPSAATSKVTPPGSTASYSKRKSLASPG